MTLIDALVEIASQGDKLGEFEYRIWRDGRRGRNWLAGAPYLWTMFIERAFVFATEQQAQRLIDQFPQELAGGQVAEHARVA